MLIQNIGVRGVDVMNDMSHVIHQNPTAMALILVTVTVTTVVPFTAGVPANKQPTGLLDERYLCNCHAGTSRITKAVLWISRYVLFCCCGWIILLTLTA